MTTWLEDRLRQLGRHKTKAGIARAIGKPPNRVTDIIHGTRRIQENEWKPLAAYLEWSVDELHLAVEGRMTRGQRIFTEALQTGTVDLPIFGATLSAGGALMLDCQPIGRAERPPLLRYSATAFGFYCTTDRHSPAFEPKDLVLVDPSRPVAPGDDVLIVKGFNIGEAQTFNGQLCRLLGQTDKHWEVRQFAAIQPHKLEKAEWPRALFVAGKYSR